MISNEPQAENDKTPMCSDHLSVIAAVPDTLRRLLGDRSAEDLRQPGQDGGDAVVEILCHLQDWEEITGERIWRTLHEDNPELEVFDDSLWSIEHDYLSRDGLEAVEQFAVQRAKLVEVLGEVCEDGLQRTARLESHGTVNLQWLIDKLVSHDEKHVSELVEAMS